MSALTDHLRRELVERLLRAGPTPSVLMCREAAHEIELLMRERARLQREADQLRTAAEKAADTFRDLATTLRLMNREVIAEACDIAQAATRNTLEESKP